MRTERDDSLATLLGGRRGALDASLPPAAFVVGWLLASNSILIGAAAAVGVGLVIGILRLVRGGKLGAVLISVAGVCAAALLALYTGRAQDFFLIQLLMNIASALAWAASIVLRWPLLGVVVGFALGQKTSWRRDPALLRAYGLASWIWVFVQYTLRVAVYATLWWAGEVVALGVARVALSWPLIAVTIAISAWVLRATLPADHPGLRHPRIAGQDPEVRRQENESEETERPAP
ncbi:uncharacterized protein DUF3159 [Tamaricihabitans halophyticus]|uniref:Uncharacterized protein DUF3159 n=1 Tax=Tamaricihabitans halophyticus TaxID=1262583 RepID=A0A4R2RA97_9PSEU|nr:uncharacterized protein DUF3159 [Tamaricihabitans halophyticus]